MSYGSIKPAGAMYLTMDAGTAKDDDGKQYTMHTGIAGNTPMVRSKQTQKLFVLPWEDILRMAIEAGIDKPDPVLPAAPR